MKEGSTRKATLALKLKEQERLGWVVIEERRSTPDGWNSVRKDGNMKINGFGDARKNTVAGVQRRNKAMKTAGKIQQS